MTLDDLIQRDWDRPFKWGEHDCTLFAARAIDVQRGGDAFERLVRGTFPNTCAKQALRHLRKEHLENLVTTALGEPIRAVNLMKEDIVLIMRGRHAMLGVFDSAQVVAPAAQGLDVLPFSAAVKGWSVCPR